MFQHIHSQFLVPPPSSWKMELYYPCSIREEPEAQRARSIAPRSHNKQAVDSGQTKVFGIHAARPQECDHGAFSSFTLPVNRFVVLTIQLCIELHLRSRACPSQPWPVLRRKRKYNSLSTKTGQIKTLSENSKESLGRFLCATWSG